jgi:hypothetical protein
MRNLRILEVLTEEEEEGAEFWTFNNIERLSNCILGITVKPSMRTNTWSSVMMKATRCLCNSMVEKGGAITLLTLSIPIVHPFSAARVMYSSR